MIYWIVTTSLIPKNFELRKQQYIYAITKTIEAVKGHPIQIIIVENNNNTESFLDEFKEQGCWVYYTNTNELDCNYGTREIIDIQKCIDHFQIGDDDYIIKQTGRYFLADNSPFCAEVCNLNVTQLDVIIKYGWWEKPSMTKVEDCISGLFCMKTKYAKTVENNFQWDFAEYRWARATLQIPDEKIHILPILGLYIDPYKTSNFILT
jgi:hypothetical protein